MFPELAARQAQGIIMRRAPVFKLRCPFQSGTILVSFLEVGILYRIYSWMSNLSILAGPTPIYIYSRPPPFKVGLKPFLPRSLKEIDRSITSVGWVWVGNKTYFKNQAIPSRKR
jgi:hypothetical protein